MPRPRTPAGSWGKIHTVKLSDEDVTPEKWRARARFRTDMGKSILVERTGISETKAETALRTALAEKAKSAAGDVDQTTRVHQLAETFLASKADKTARTIETYRQSIEHVIVPRIGDLAVAEATPGRLSRFLDIVKTEHGIGTAKTARSVLSGVFGLAVQTEAVKRNPVRDVSPITGKATGAPQIPLDELPIILEKVRGDERLQHLDMIDLIAFAASTGARIGEIVALEWGSVDLDASTVTIEANAVRAKGQGVIRQPHAKTDAGVRRITIPSALADTLHRRKTGSTSGYVFPTVLGNLRDPRNTSRDWALARDRLNIPPYTFHSFRKTVATALDQAGLSARDIAEYLGHSDPSLTMGTYMSKTVGGKRAADALDGLLDRK